ncbi:MAG: hypothetical protein ACN6OP_18135 [Pseudomonadales bacterium]
MSEVITCWKKPVRLSPVSPQYDEGFRDGVSESERLNAADFDRVTAERDALQERLNAADQKDDDLSFQLTDREGSRREWFDEAQRLQAELHELTGKWERFEEFEHGLQAKLAERDALLERCRLAVLNGEDFDLPASLLDEIKALSASAEPSAAKCKTCNRSKVVDDGELTHSAGGIPYECGPIKCVKDCPDCGDTGLEPCSKHGWKP